ncbi:MAG: tail fiber domain-containing protein [Phycisphaerae bacterium]|nr:tail fiber domain-containing protein [Phycisphaerae bacterium]
MRTTLCSATISLALAATASAQPCLPMDMGTYCFVSREWRAQNNGAGLVAIRGVNTNLNAGYAGYFQGRGFFQGKVGVGVANPLGFIDMAAGNNADGTPSAAALAFTFRTGGLRHFITTRHNAFNGPHTNNAFDFWLNKSATPGASVAPGTGNNRVMTIDGNGRLWLYGPAGAGISSRDVNAGAFTGWDVYMDSTKYSVSRSGIDFPFSISATNGAATFVGTVFAASFIQLSSRDAKSEIAPLAGALDTIGKLRGVTYQWNEHAPAQIQGRHDIGFIADEVNEVLPEIVGKDEAGKPTGIDYAKIAPLAVEAIKELKAENERIRADNADLKARLERLEALLGSKPGTSIERQGR